MLRMVSLKAAALAPEMRCKPEFILSQKKDTHGSNFALFAKNITPGAMTFAVPFGVAEGCERLSGDEYVELLEFSREAYGEAPEARVETVSEFDLADELPVDEVPAPEPPANVIAEPQRVATCFVHGYKSLQVELSRY